MCLQALWDLGEGSVHQVREALAARREFAYTTVLTLLDRLEKRGSVKRRKQGRSFVYKPKLSREVLRKLAVKDLVDSLFDGSRAKLRRYLK